LTVGETGFVCGPFAWPKATEVIARSAVDAARRTTVRGVKEKQFHVVPIRYLSVSWDFVITSS